MGNQANTQNKLKNDGQTRHYERSGKTKEMVTVDVDFELVHVEQLQHRRHDEDQSKQDFQG